jgi:hypothetical protein
MDRRCFALRAAAFLVLLFGCAPAPVVEVAPPGPDHAHLIERTMVVGDNHVSLLVDHQAGEAALLVTDRLERPLPISARSLPATFRLPDGTVREATFEPICLRCRKGACLCSEYALRQDWLTGAHRFELTSIVPIEGARYRVTFDYSTSAAESVHHRHERLE